MTPTQFQKKLLTWFDLHGRKELPWQINKTPYRIWISEIMLQQTQVQTVIPYYLKFMQRFPNIKALAAADINEVLHLWAGLGYYSRARNLHKSANMIASTSTEDFPNTLETLTQLPGIGPSTAGAILAIAYEQQATILDGNVKRVLARVYGIESPINEKKTESDMWNLAVSLTPKRRVADYTQAIMDLGATCCTRSKPQCTQCPMKKSCIAHQENLTDVLPQKKAKKPIPTRIVTFLILKHKNQVLLQKRPEKGAVWGGLFCFPELNGLASNKQINNYCNQHWRHQPQAIQSLTEFKHTFSHYHLNIHPILINLKKKPTCDQNSIWYNLKTPQTVGLPRPIQKIIKGLNP